MTVISRQCGNATLTKLALRTTYVIDCDKENLIKFLYRLKLICCESDNGGLSYQAYKVVVAGKSLHNFTNPKPDDPHRFKEEVKVKYDATMVIVGKFPNRTALMEQLLKENTPSKTWDSYCAMIPTEQLTWEEKVDNFVKAVFLL